MILNYDLIDLRDLKGEDLKIWKKAIKKQIDWCTFQELKENEPIMIREHYFQEYAQEFAVNIGAINDNFNWPINHIDWEEATDDLKNDYSEIEIDGEIYLCKSF